MASRRINTYHFLLLLFLALPVYAEDSLQELLSSNCEAARANSPATQEVTDLFGRVLNLDPAQLGLQAAGLGLIVAFDNSGQLEARRCVLLIAEERPEIRRELIIPLIKFVNNPATISEQREIARDLVIKSVIADGRTFSEEMIRRILRESGNSYFLEVILNALVRYSPLAPEIMLDENLLTDRVSASFESPPYQLLNLNLKSEQILSVIQVVEKSKDGINVIIDKAISVCDERRFISKSLLNLIFQKRFAKVLALRLDKSGKHREFLECLEKSSNVTPEIVQPLITLNSSFRQTVVKRASELCGRFNLFFSVIEDLKDTQVDECLVQGLAEDPRVIEVLIRRPRWTSSLAETFSKIADSNSLTPHQRLSVLTATIYAVPFVAVRSLSNNLPELLKTKIDHSLWRGLVPVLRKYRSRVAELVETSKAAAGASRLLAVLAVEGLYPVSSLPELDDEDRYFLIQNLPESNFSGELRDSLLKIDYAAIDCGALADEVFMKRVCLQDCRKYLDRLAFCRASGTVPLIEASKNLSKENFRYFAEKIEPGGWERLADDEILMLLNQGIFPDKASPDFALRTLDLVPEDQEEKVFSLLPDELKEQCGYWRNKDFNRDLLPAALEHCPAVRLIQKKVLSLQPSEREEFIGSAVHSANEKVFETIFKVFGKEYCRSLSFPMEERAASLSESARFTAYLLAVSCQPDQSEALVKTREFIQARNISELLGKFGTLSNDVREIVTSLLGKLKDESPGSYISFLSDVLLRGLEQPSSQD